MNKLNLFTPVVDETKLNPNFINAIKEKAPYVRDVLTTWAEGFPDRDGKFICEFQTTFNSSFWELYLFAVLKRLNYPVNFEFVSPDFCNDSFCLEATIASHPEDGIPEWERDYGNVENWSLEEALDLSTVRLANAFISKARKFKEYYIDLPHVKEKPFILAIAPFEQPFFFTQSQHAIRRVLYSFDRVRAVDWTKNFRELFGTVLMDRIKKENGSYIQLGYFLNPDFADISAVMFSNTATWSKARVLSKDPRVIFVNAVRYNENGLEPINVIQEKTDYKETLFDGISILHNPYAKYPLDEKWFRSPEIGHLHYDLAKNEMIADFPHGFLFQRSVSVFDCPRSPKLIETIRKFIMQQFETEKQVYPKVFS